MPSQLDVLVIWSSQSNVRDREVNKSLQYHKFCTRKKKSCNGKAEEERDTFLFEQELE